VNAPDRQPDHVPPHGSAHGIPRRDGGLDEGQYEREDGKTLAQWLKITKAAKLEKHGQIVKLLKGDHGMTHGFANMVAHETLATSAEHTDDSTLVETQYAGKKAELKPIYDALIAVISKLGKDVEIAPKKAYVSLRRNKQFAILQPSTATRLDVGLCMKGEPTTDRLEASGSFNAMCSHRVRVTSKKDINAELKAWLRQAYGMS